MIVDIFGTFCRDIGYKNICEIKRLVFTFSLSKNIKNRNDKRRAKLQKCNKVC